MTAIILLCPLLKNVTEHDISQVSLSFCPRLTLHCFLSLCFLNKSFILQPCSSFKLFLELDPQIRDVLHKFYESQYASCLKILDDIKVSTSRITARIEKGALWSSFLMKRGSYGGKIGDFSCIYTMRTQISPT